jgi:hypothetical protein
MDQLDSRRKLDEAFASLEDSIFPGIAAMLDSLIEAAALCRPGVNAEVHAVDLDTIALQLETLTRQVEALAPIPTRKTAYPDARDASISA